MTDNKIITDREEMLETVKKDGTGRSTAIRRLIKYASKELKNDPELKKLAEG